MGRIPGFVKWVVSPAIAGALGFFVLAPAVQGRPAIRKIVDTAAAHVLPGEVKKTDPPVKDETPEPSRSEPTASEPSVHVGVKPVVDSSSTGPQRRHRRHRAPSAEEAKPIPDTEPPRNGPDPASTPDN